MSEKKEVQFLLTQHLNQLQTRWLAHADEANKYKNLYEEANLFVQRAIERLPEDHPLHPYNYKDLFSEDYARDLATVFEEQDIAAADKTDPEMEEVVGLQDVPVEDVIDKVPTMDDDLPGVDGEEFNVSDYNKQIMQDAEEQGTTFRESI